MAKGKRFFNKRYIVVVGSEREWNSSAISKRINSNGGHHQSDITKETTHLVVTSKAWKKQDKKVGDASALNDDIDNERKTKQKHRIHIVSFDWLDDSWRGEKAKPEEPYKWEKIDPKPLRKVIEAEDEENSDAENSNSEPQKAKKKASGKPPAKSNAKKAKVIEEPKNQSGMMVEVLQQSTDKYVSATEAAEIKKRQEREARVREELAEEEKRAAEEKKAAAAFKVRAKKCRNEIFSENHHIYTDETGFKYDVLLTKVDTRRNKNERWALTIYESNVEPYTYAVNAQFAGTDTRPANNVLVALGSPIFTAFHAFKGAFKENTGIEWDSRISFHLERAKREKQNRGIGTGSDHGTQKGVPVSENSAAAKSKAAEEEPFQTRSFQYHPPAYGAVGTLSDDERKKFEIAKAAESEKAQDGETVNKWMEDPRAAGPAQQPDTIDLMSHIEDRGSPLRAEELFGAPPPRANDEILLKDFDFDRAFDYPYDSESLQTADMPINQSDTLQNESFNYMNNVTNSFAPGTQQIGETQLAEKARGEFMEYLDKPRAHPSDHVDTPMAEYNIKDEASTNGTDQSADDEDVIGVNKPILDLGSSILGKRKASSAGSSQERKKLKPAEIPDSFAEGSYTDDASLARADDHVPRSFRTELEEYAADAADEQLQSEMAGERCLQID